MLGHQLFGGQHEGALTFMRPFFYEKYTKWETYHMLTQNVKVVGVWILSLI